MIHQNRTLVKLTNGWARNVRPQELIGLQFYSQRKSGEGENNFFLSRLYASIIISRLSRGVFLSLGGQAGPQMIVFYVFREHLGIINLLSSLGRMWDSCHHRFIPLGHVLCYCCLDLLLSKPTFLSNH